MLFLFILPVFGGCLAIWWALRLGEIAAGGAIIHRGKAPLPLWVAVGPISFVMAALLILRVTER